MVNSFINAGLWSTIDYAFASDCSESLDENYCINDVSNAFKLEASEFIDKFMISTEGLFTNAEIDRDHLGHDLWLTVEGHGSGFWDGDYEQGYKITEIVKVLRFYNGNWGEKLNESINREVP